MSTTYGKSDPIMGEIRALLLSAPVQRIQFRFGSIQILPLDFRHLEVKLADPSSFVSIRIDPQHLKNIKAIAAYENPLNQFVFSSLSEVRTPAGRGEVLHEATHAIFDLRDSVVMGLAEEATCFIVGALYHIETGTEQEFLNRKHSPDLLSIVASAKKRARLQMPEFSVSERVKIRRILTKEYGYRPHLKWKRGGFRSPFL